MAARIRRIIRAADFAIALFIGFPCLFMPIAHADAIDAAGHSRTTAGDPAGTGMIADRVGSRPAGHSKDRRTGFGNGESIVTSYRRTHVRTTAAVAARTVSGSAGPAIHQPMAPAPRIPEVPRPATAAPQIPAPAASAVATAGSPPAASIQAGISTLARRTANLVGDLINGVMLMIRRTFFNRAPSASPEQTGLGPSGQMWGFVGGSDPEGDPVTYTLTQAPHFGTVTVDEHGFYTYRPGPDFAGTDTFTATIDDPGFHIDLLNPFASHKTAVAVIVQSSGADPAGTVIDTFDGPAGSKPNAALWKISVGTGFDAGAQAYTDDPGNVALDGQGHLVIQARPTAGGYTSGEITTMGTLNMTFGTVTARIKFPAGQGIWPAFWMLGSTFSRATWNAAGPTGWPGCGEIDVMELVNTASRYYVTLHGPQGGTDYYGGVGGTGQVVGTSGPIADLSESYHDYWVTREPDSIIVGVDDTTLGVFTPAALPPNAQWVFNQPMFAVLNVAVGGPWPGLPDATTPWPATMLVDRFTYTPTG